MQLVEFATWLRSQPADRMYNDGPRSESCPIAAFSGKPSAAQQHDLPEWASYFIREFDEFHEMDASQALALRVLNFVELEFGIETG